MKLAIILLLTLAGLVIGLFVYRTLIRSKSFANLIGGVIEPPPETPDEVIRHLDGATSHADDCADRCDATARSARGDALAIRRRR